MTAFGACCKDLNDCLTIPQQKFFFETEEGVLYLTIGGVQTDQGMGWMDQAVLFCPFCGSRLQTRDEIRLKSSPTASQIH